MNPDLDRVAALLTRNPDVIPMILGIIAADAPDVFAAAVSRCEDIVADDEVRDALDAELDEGGAR